MPFRNSSYSQSYPPWDNLRVEVDVANSLGEWRRFTLVRDLVSLPTPIYQHVDNVRLCADGLTAGV